MPLRAESFQADYNAAKGPCYVPTVGARSRACSGRYHVILAFDAFEFDVSRLELRHAGRVVKADPLVLRLLAALATRSGELVTKEELLLLVWSGRAVSENVLTVTMARLRKTLSRADDETDFVTNVFGRGYRFLRPIERREGKLEPIIDEPHAAVSSMPLVGRDQALKTMRSVLAETSAGHGHALLVSGEAGIGKTRVVEELACEAEAAGLPVTWAHCREPGATPPLWPFAQLVRGTLAKSGVDTNDERVRMALRELGRLVPELDATDSAPDANEPQTGHVDLGAKHRLFDAVTQLLLMAATPRVSVLVLDDLHQADAATLELLRYLVDEIGHSRLLVLATMRSPLGAASVVSLRPLIAHRNCSSVTLQRLNEQNVTDCVMAALGARGASLSHAVFVKSEGNPFFMHQLLRQLADNASSDPEALVASKAALELARQRLHDLDETTREVLSCAAVIGRSFELPLLQAVTGLGMGELMSSLEAAWGSDILVPAPDSRTAFAFDHDLLREALYESVSPAERRRLHRSVAQAFEQRAQAGEGVSAYTLAHHLHAALPDSDLRVCIRYCIAAAADAGAAYAYADGARYLGHAREALDLLPDGSPRLRLKLVFGQALYARAYSSADYQRLIYEVMRIAGVQRDAVMLARGALLLDTHPGFPPVPGARAALDGALAVLPVEERGLRAAVLARRATSAPDAYDSERSGEQVASARALIGDTKPPLARYTALSAQLYLRGGPAHRAEATACMQELRELCEQYSQQLTLPPAFMELHRAITSQQDGDLLAQDTALARAEKLARAVGSRELLWHALRFAAHALINVGDSERGITNLQELHRRARQDSLLGTELLCVYDREVVLRSATGAAYETEPTVLAPDPADPPSIWSIKVRALAARGDRREAHIALSMFPAKQLTRLPCDRDYLGTLGSLVHAALAVDALDYMAALYELLAPYESHFAAHVAFACQGSVAQLRGMLAHRLGHPIEAIRLLKLGSALCEQAGFKPSAEQARLELASLQAE